MTFHMGIGSNLTKDGVALAPRFTCDRCGVTKDVPSGGRRGPPMWFRDKNAPPGWVAHRNSNGLYKTHLCGKCRVVA